MSDNLGRDVMTAMQRGEHIARRLTRSELYELVWSEPIRSLAARFGISDVALAKTCRKTEIPLPGSGYWAKRHAGKTTKQIPLTPRGIGMSDEVIIGGGYYWGHGPTDAEILGPLPPPPSFEEPISDVRPRVRKLVGAVRVPKTLGQTHPLIARLLEEDDRRREKQRNSPYSFSFSWETPLFDTPLQRRRLRILNTMFLALAKAGAKPWLRGKETLELGIRVGEQYVNFSLNQLTEQHRPGRAGASPAKSSADKLRLEIKSARSSKGVCVAWQDSETDTLEHRAQEIVVEMIVSGEMQYREACEHQYAWRIKRRAELEEEARRHRAEAERKERERQLRLERERVERLLNEASALCQANEIRAYVAAVEAANETSAFPVPADELRTWQPWALGQADRIDPVANGTFRDLSAEEEGTA